MSGDERIGFVDLRKAETAAVMEKKKVAACFQRAQTLNPQSRSSRAHEAAVREAVKGISLQPPPHPTPREGVAPWVSPMFRL